MAASLYSGNGRSSGRGAAGRYRPMSEINVTPLVDVMLVLLVVFMVTAPLLTVGVPVDSLVERLQAITGNNPDTALYIRGDKEINYGRFLEVMSLVTAAGFHKVSLVAETPKVGTTPARRAVAVKR